MPAKNKKQLNFFLLVKAFKENGEIGVKRQWKFLDGYKPRLTPVYIGKLVKTADSITDADLIDKTSGIEGDDQLGDTRKLKPGYWALFRGKYKIPNQTDEIPKEGKFIAQIKNVNQQKGVVNFNHNGFRNKYGQTMIIPKRANTSSLEFMYLDYALFSNIIKTGRSPEEISEERISIEESTRNIVRQIFLKEGAMTNRPLFKKGDKVKYKSSATNFFGYTTKIFTVIQNETRDSYGVYINQFDNIEPENAILYKEDNKIKEGSTIFNEKLSKNKLEIKNSHSNKKSVINKSDLVGYFIKDYILELA